MHKITFTGFTALSMSYDVVKPVKVIFYLNYLKNMLMVFVFFLKNSKNFFNFWSYSKIDLCHIAFLFIRLLKLDVFGILKFA